MPSDEQQVMLDYLAWFQIEVFKWQMLYGLSLDDAITKVQNVELAPDLTPPASAPPPRPAH